MNGDSHSPAGSAAQAARRGGEATPRARAEPSLWTSRMLAALETRVKGGRWYSIRWPNAYFHESGLFSMHAARQLAGQSSRRQDRQLESRVREIRTHGSEGGAAQSNAPSLPLSR